MKAHFFTFVGARKTDYIGFIYTPKYQFYLCQRQIINLVSNSPYAMISNVFVCNLLTFQLKFYTY